MTKTEQAVIRAAMKESRCDIARDWCGNYLSESQRMINSAKFSGLDRARRLRACAAHAKSAKGRR